MTVVAYFREEHDSQFLCFTGLILPSYLYDNKCPHLIYHDRHDPEKKKKKDFPNMVVCLFPIAIYFSEPKFTSVVCYLSGFSMEKERKSLCVASHGEMTSAWRVNSGQEGVFSLPGNKDITAVK